MNWAACRGILGSSSAVTVDPGSVSSSAQHGLAISSSYKLASPRLPRRTRYFGGLSVCGAPTGRWELIAGWLDTREGDSGQIKRWPEAGARWFHHSIAIYQQLYTLLWQIGLDQRGAATPFGSRARLWPPQTRYFDE